MATEGGHDVLRQLGAYAFALTLAFAVGVAWQRLGALDDVWRRDIEQRVQAIDAWKAAVDGQKFLTSDGTVLEQQLRSEIRTLATELRGDQRVERAFVRAICHAVSGLQASQNLSVTNDCDRP